MIFKRFSFHRKKPELCNICKQEMLKNNFYSKDKILLKPFSKGLFEYTYRWVFVFPGPWPFTWPPVLALAPGPRLRTLPPALALNLYLPALAPPLCLPALAPNLYLPALAPNLYLPQICIYRFSLMPEFAYTYLVSPICIYWPWPTICTLTGC